MDLNTAIAVNTVTAIDHISRCLQAELVPMLEGHPGIGKSAIGQEIARIFNLEPIDIRLSTFDPCDFNGFPMVIDGVATFVPMDTFPLEGRDKVPPGKDGWLIILDEFSSASLAVQVAAYRLLLDREVGGRRLHPNTAIMGAGNLATSGAVVNRQSTATQSRLVHLELMVDPEGWLKWASQNQLDHRTLAYISHKPESLHSFDPKHNDKTFACPRTWEFCSRLIAGVPTEDLGGLVALLAGTIGEGVAHEFIAYTEIYSQIPTYQEILKDPATIGVPTDPAMFFAVSHMIAAFLKKSEIGKLMTYLDRLPVEFQTIILQSAIQRDRSFIREPAVVKWIAVKGKELF